MFYTGKIILRSLETFSWGVGEAEAGYFLSSASSLYTAGHIQIADQWIIEHIYLYHEANKISREKHLPFSDFHPCG